MASNSYHLWGKRTAVGCAGLNINITDSPPGPLSLNNLSPQDSIEDNEKIQNINIMGGHCNGNVESRSNVTSQEHASDSKTAHDSNRKKSLPRQKSLCCYEKELQSILRRCIHENIDKNKIADEGNPQMAGGHSVAASDGRGGQNDDDTRRGRTTKSAIYATYLQRGDNNLMLLCEPMGPPKKTKCCKQIGNNNVMVNVTVNTNRCQIINEQGKVYPIDSDGEFWLEIRKRRESSEGTPKTWPFSATPESSLNPTPEGAGHNGVFSCRASYNDARLAREPVENEYNEPINTRISSIYLDSRLPDPGRNPLEHYDSSKTLILGNIPHSENEASTRNFRIDEQPDAIVMKFETVPGSPRLSGCRRFEDWPLVQTVLEHEKVVDFFQRQEKGSDVDVSVVGWEYELEEIYSTIPHDETGLSEENGFYSSPVQLVKKPTLPPPRQLQSLRPVHGDAAPEIQREPTLDGHAYDSIEELDVKKNTLPPTLPPRRYKEPEENSDQSSSSLSYISAPSGLENHQREHGAVGNITYCSDTSLHVSLPKPQECSRKGLPSPPCRPTVAPRYNKSKQDTPCSQGHRLEAPWYHAGISSGDAKTLLSGKPNGSFLVRDTNGEHKYTLELVDAENIRRLKIWFTDNKYHLEKGSSKGIKDFESVEGLIEKAMKTGIEVCNKTTPYTWRTVSIYPVHRP